MPPRLRATPESPRGRESKVCAQWRILMRRGHVCRASDGVTAFKGVFNWEDPSPLPSFARLQPNWWHRRLSLRTPSSSSSSSPSFHIVLLPVSHHPPPPLLLPTSSSISSSPAPHIILLLLLSYVPPRPPPRLYVLHPRSSSSSRSPNSPRPAFLLSPIVPFTPVLFRETRAGGGGGNQTTKSNFEQFQRHFATLI